MSSKSRWLLEFLSTLGYLSCHRYPCLSSLKRETVTTCPPHPPPPPSSPPQTISSSTSSSTSLPSTFHFQHPRLVFWSLVEEEHGTPLNSGQSYLASPLPSLGLLTHPRSAWWGSRCVENVIFPRYQNMGGGMDVIGFSILIFSGKQEFGSYTWPVLLNAKIWMCQCVFINSFKKFISYCTEKLHQSCCRTHRVPTLLWV